MKPLFKKTAGSALAVLLSCSVLSACSNAPVKVTKDDAPTEQMKNVAAITSESSSQDVVDVFRSLIDATSEESGHRLIFTEDVSGKGLSLESDTLETVENSYKNYDVRYGTEDAFYQLYEEVSSAEPIFGLMKSSPENITTVYLHPDEENEEAQTVLGVTPQDFTITDIAVSDSALKDTNEEELKSSVNNAVVYPLNTLLGASLVLQPTDLPSMYTYDLEKSGSQYTWTISIKDVELYNKQLDEAYLAGYGHERNDIRGDGSFVLDSCDITEVTMKLTMNENGALSDIAITNKSTAVMGDESVDLFSTDQITIKQAPETWGEFFTAFFDKIEDKSLCQNDSFTLLGDLDKTDSESSSAAKDESTSKSEADTKSESKEQSKSKASSASKEQSASKSESKSESSSESESESKADSKAQSQSSTK